MARVSGVPRLAALAAIALTLAAGPAMAQAPSAGAPSDLAMDALMVADDLPTGFTSDGPQVGSDFNIDQAAFDAHGGEAVVTQVWNRTADAGPIIVFDFRMVFPTAADAAAYLDDAEAALSEREPSNLKWVKNAPAVGEHHRLYAGTAEISSMRFAFQNHLFTNGRIAAKVFVSAHAGNNAAGAANGIARAAAERMSVAQAGDPTVTPSPTAAPSGGPDIAPILEAVLVARVPAGITDCLPERTRAFAGELAAIFCPIGNAGERLVMRQLDSPDTLATVFADFSGSDPGKTGACQKRAALEPRLDGDATVGQLACYDAKDGTRVFMWTDERFGILSWFVAAQDRPFKQLYRLYESAGPLAIESPVASPGASAEADLLAHVPAAIRDTCTRTDFGVSATALAALACSASVGDGSVTITYQAHPDAASLGRGYTGNLSFLDVTRDAGPCSGEWPGEASYNISGAPGGRVGCAEFGDTARFITWTDDRLLIQGYAEGFGVARADLYQWWLDDSGPV